MAKNMPQKSHTHIKLEIFYYLKYLQCWDHLWMVPVSIPGFDIMVFKILGETGWRAHEIYISEFFCNVLYPVLFKNKKLIIKSHLKT